MSNFSITRRIEIDAAHRVPDHRSKCFNIHGHRYVIEATCEGPTISSGEQTGMVMDFSFLKDCMMKVIHEPCDHGCIFWKDDPMLGPRAPYTTEGSHIHSDVVGWKLCIIPFVPTAENLARMWYNELEHEIWAFFQMQSEILTPPKLTRVTVYETPNCVAWYPSGPELPTSDQGESHV